MDWNTITQTGARASGVEEPTPRMAVHHRAHGSDSERDTTWSYGVHEGRMQTYVLRGVCGLFQLYGESLSERTVENHVFCEEREGGSNSLRRRSRWDSNLLIYWKQRSFVAQRGFLSH